MAFQAAQAPSPLRGRSWPWLAAVLVPTALVFWNALRGGFVYDDLQLVRSNPALVGVGPLLEALARPYWGFAEGESGLGVGYWRPLSTGALFVGDRLGGGAPAGFHAVSLILHLAAVAAGFRLVAGLTGSPLAATAGGLVLALHPVQVESVAWISAVGDPLAGLLVLAGLVGFVRWRERGSRGSPLSTAACLLLGLLAKESAVALVPLVVALDLARGGPRPVVRAYLPLVGALALWWALRAWVFGSPLAGFDLVSSHLFVPAARQLSLRVELLGGALALLAWPAELNLFREVRPLLPPGDPELIRAWIALALLAVALGAALATRRRRLAFALAVVPLALAPALISFESIGRFPLSERFLYVAVLSPALLVALAVATLEAHAPRPVLALPVVLLAAWSGAQSHARVDVWRDELALFRASAQASPQSAYVRWGLGRVLLEDYRQSGDLATLDEAHEAFLAAQDMTSPADGSAPDPALLVTPYDQLQASLGVAWYLLICARDDPDECTFEEAELVFEELVRRTADSPYRLSHGRALTGLGIARSQVGRLAEAELALEEATVLAPELSEAWFALAELERRRGDLPAAEAAYRSALERTPRDAELQAALGETLVAQGRETEGRELLERAARAGAQDESWQAHVQLGVLAGQEGRFNEALARFDRALALDPDAAPAHLNRGKALLQLGRTAEASEAFGEACRTDPRSFEAHYNLGVLLLQTGQTVEARAHLRAALELDPDHELADRIRAALQSGG